MSRTFNPPSRSGGFSMVELLVAMTVGLLLLTGLALIFVNSSNTNRELQKTAQQIENGRYATDIINQDLRHAGFYGHLHEIPAAVGTPDPCEIGSTTNLYNALGFSVQGYRAADFDTAADVTATSCDTALLTAANLKPGSDVVVVRRAGTSALAATSVAVANEVYIQATGTQAEVQLGNGAAIGTNKANGAASSLFFANGTTPAPVRKYHVHVYFVAPCSFGSGTGGVCQAGDDTIPTLKRLELTSVSGATAMRIVPLAEGIEYLKVEYGVDNLPNVVAPETGLLGDSTVDSWTTAPADWTTVIAAKVYILARNTEATSGHVDTKSYVLGTATVSAQNDAFRRHVYAASVRMINAAGRREIP